VIDLYCERVGPGLWAEPVNATTNLAFFLTAWATWALARRLQTLSASTWLLIALVVAIGIGSSLFHTFATTWARVLDALPILFFQLAYLWLYSRAVIKLRTGTASALVAVFLVAALIGRQFPHILNGSKPARECTEPSHSRNARWTRLRHPPNSLTMAVA